MPIPPDIMDGLKNELGDSDLVLRASLFAFRAHDGQTRSDDSPYIDHPTRVAGLLGEYGVSNPETVAAAWLHDTIEDCGVTRDQLAEFFGDQVADTVEELTNIVESKNLSKRVTWTFRHASLLEHARRMSDSAKWIKLADRLDNLSDSQGSWKPKRLKRYARSGFELLEALRPWPQGSEPLAERLLETIHGILPPDELASHIIVDDVRE